MGRKEKFDEPIDWSVPDESEERDRKAGDNPVVFGRVVFQSPADPLRAKVRLSIGGLYWLLLGVWAIVGSWNREPVLGLVAGFLYAELGLGTLRSVSFVGRVVYTDRLAQRVVPPLVELCDEAGCLLPRVVLRDDVVRAAAVRPGKGRTRLVLSTRFVDRVDDRQLRAILAHEVSHIARRDLRWAKARAWGSLGVGAAAGIAAAAVSQAHGIAFPVYFAAFILVSMVVQVMLALLNQRIERRADCDGAVLSKDPAGLASALRVAYRFTHEARLQMYGPVPWRWLLSPISWSLPTHPPMERRIAMLESLAETHSP